MSINDLLHLLQKRRVVLRKEAGRIFADWYDLPPDQELVDAIRANRRVLEDYLDDLACSGPLPVNDTDDATRAQKRIWLACQSNAGLRAYNVGCKLQIDGPLEIDLLREAIHSALGRFTSLRAYFIETSGGLHRKIRHQFDGIFIDRTSFYYDHVHELRLATASFELNRGPLVRITLCRSNGSHILYVVLHHILTDGVGVQLFVRAIFERYAQGSGAQSPFERVQVQDSEHTRHIALERRYAESSSYLDDLRYWSECLSGYDSTPVLVPDFEHDENLGRAVTLAGNKKGLVRSQLHEQCRLMGCTPHHLLLTCAFIALRDLSCQQDFAICIPVHLRDHATQFNAMGLFLNVLPIRVQLQPIFSFEQCLEAVRRAFDEAYLHKRAAFEDIAQSAVAKAPSSRLMSTMFVHNEIPNSLQKIGDLLVSALPLPSPGAKCDFNLFANECSDRIFCSLEFNADRFSWLTAEALLDRFEAALRSVISPLRKGRMADHGDADEALRLQRWQDTVTSLLSFESNQDSRVPQYEIAYEMLGGCIPIKRAVDAIAYVLEARLATSPVEGVVEAISWNTIVSPGMSNEMAFRSYLLDQRITTVFRFFVAVEGDHVHALGVIADPRYCFSYFGASAIAQDVAAWLTGRSLAKLQLPQPLLVPEAKCSMINGLRTLDAIGIQLRVPFTPEETGWSVANVMVERPISDEMPQRERYAIWLSAIAIALYRYSGVSSMALEVNWPQGIGNNALSGNFLPVSIDCDPKRSLGNLQRMVEALLFSLEPLTIIAPSWSRVVGAKEDELTCRVQVTFGAASGYISVSQARCIHLNVSSDGAVQVAVKRHWFDSDFSPIFAASLATIISANNSADTPIALIGGCVDNQSIDTSTSDIDYLLDPDATLISHFIEQTRQLPTAVALQRGERIKTYSALLDETRITAAALRKAGAGRGTLVAVLVSDPFDCACALLAIVMSGAAYLPLDQYWPPLRRKSVLENAVPDLFITDTIALDQTETKTLRWPLCVSPDVTLDASDAIPTIEPNDLAYVIYTSGSTGTPKGVAMTHASAMNTILDVGNRIQLCPRDTIYTVSSVAFDLSVFDLFGALAFGARVVFPQPDEYMLPSAWVNDIENYGVTVWNSVPALAQLLIEKLEGKEHSTTLRTVMLSGDRIPVYLPKMLRTTFNLDHLLSLGGATEAGIWSIAYSIKNASNFLRSIPYGRPLIGQEIMILDADGHCCPVNVPGEIHILGTGLAKGYWRAPELTVSAFFLHPKLVKRMYRTGDIGYRRSDGVFEILGRIDKRVKLHGNRIELVEVESILRSHPDVLDAIVWIMGENLEASLIAAVRTKDGELPHKLSYWLGQQVPAAMRPTRYIAVKSWPLTANGKVDSLALKEKEKYSIKSRDVTTPKTPSEVYLHGVWHYLMDFTEEHQISIHDDFFDIGGHSLLAVKMLEIINKKVRHVSYRVFLKNTSIYSLAKYIDECV